MLERLNQIFYIYFRTFQTCIYGPRRFDEILRQIVLIGIHSLPIILVSTAFAGTIVTSEIAFHMDVSLHAVTMVPGYSGQFIFRELAIAIPVLLLVAKVGASTTAEISTMKITEQIDALKLLQIDPIEYLVYPRFVASIFAVSCLVLFSIFSTLSCAILVAVVGYNFSVLEYINSLTHFIEFTDLLGALIKGMVYGAVIPIISCFYGFRCTGGAQGVGEATTKSVVTSTMVIIILDFALTFIFSQLM